MTPLSLAAQIGRVCLLRGTFRLRSGQTSTEYFDKYLFESDPALLKAIGVGLSALVPPGTEMLAGLELGGVPVAVSLALAQAHPLPLLFVRKKAKEYGTAKLAEGPAFSGKRVTVVEDVVTTGGAILDAVQALRAGGARVEHVLCVIDRESGGTEKLKEVGLTLTPLFRASELRAAAQAPTA